MNNILKSFSFECEQVRLDLFIRKEFRNNYLLLIIDAKIESNNPDLIISTATNISSKNYSLSYLNQSIFWISTNDWKGIRWEKYSNESRISVFREIGEMKDAYIIQREFVSKVSNYFYDCIKNYKKTKLLFETTLDEIIHEDYPE